MFAALNGERTLTKLDFARLHLSSGQLPTELKNSFEFPNLVASRDIPADFVTMCSQVEIVDQISRRQQKLTICYPDDAEPTLGFISVLSPVGASLLGLSVGAIAHWYTPRGELCTAEITALLFQPEASGDYTT
jgi:regulator of nucleoside diphosphate kinase